MRSTCMHCVLKHLSQAIILIHESEMGYPEHKWLAIGHLAEASDEALSERPELAREIRAIRKDYETNDDPRGLWGTFQKTIKELESGAMQA